MKSDTRLHLAPNSQKYRPQGVFNLSSQTDGLSQYKLCWNRWYLNRLFNRLLTTESMNVFESKCELWNNVNLKGSWGVWLAWVMRTLTEKIWAVEGWRIRAGATVTPHHWMGCDSQSEQLSALPIFITHIRNTGWAASTDWSTLTQHPSHSVMIVQ